MGYYSDFSGEVVLAGAVLNKLKKYHIRLDPDSCRSRLTIYCEGERTGYYVEPVEPSGFRVGDAPETVTCFPGDELEKAYGFSEFARAVHRMWRDGFVKSAELRRTGEESNDLEHYFLRKGKWKQVQVIEKSVSWRPR